MFIIGVVATLILWFTTNMPLWMCAAIVILVALVMKSGVGGLVTGTVNTVRDFFSFLVRLLIGSVLFTVIMALGARATGIAPARVMERLQILGPPWTWPENVGLPILLFLVMGVLAAGVAMKFVQGQPKYALWILIPAAVIMLLLLYFPTTKTAVDNAVKAPNTTGATTSTSYDEAISQKGVVSPAVSAAEVVVIGQPNDRKQRGAVGSTFCRTWHWSFGDDTSFLWIWCKQAPPQRTATASDETAPASPKKSSKRRTRTSSPVYTVATVTPVATKEMLDLVGECHTPCSMYLPPERFKIRTDGKDFCVLWPVDKEDDWTYVPPSGDYEAPRMTRRQMTSKPTEFKSPDGSTESVRIQLYRKVQVPVS